MCGKNKNCACGCPVKTIKESETKKIVIIARDPDNTISDLLNTIKQIGSQGHGFEILVDPELKPENDEDGIKTEFYWDGDGGDSIREISIQEVDDEDTLAKEEEEHNHDSEDKHEDSHAEHTEATPEFKAEWKKGMDKDFDKVEKELHEAEKKMDPTSLKVFNLLKKYYKRANAANKKMNGKFMGFTDAEGKDNREIQNLKNEAWDVARKGNLDTNEIMALDRKAKMEAEGKKKMSEAEDYDYYINWAKQLKKNGEIHGYEVMKGKALASMEGNLIDGEIVENKELNEASKVNLKLSSNAKRDLIKKAKTALDNLYMIYDACERLAIDNQKFIDQLDEAFEGTNEMLTILITQESIEKK